MPVIPGKDSVGPFYKYGETGKQYYYTAGNQRSRLRALMRSKKQGKAIEYSKHKNKNKK